MPKRFVSGLHSAWAQRTGLVFRGKTSADLPRWVLYLVSIFCVNQTDSVLNFTRGQTSADYTCVYWNDNKHSTLRKIRATFLSLPWEKRDVSWSKAITSPSIVFPAQVKCESNFNYIFFVCSVGLLRQLYCFQMIKKLIIIMIIIINQYYANSTGQNIRPIKWRFW